MNIPTDIKYHREHTWLKVEDNRGTIGITDFAQKELGEIVYVDLPNLGVSFDYDEVFGTVEAIKTVSDLFMPVTGKVIEVNQKLLKEPTLVNTDPYSEGWMLKVELDGTLPDLLNADTYQSMTE